MNGNLFENAVRKALDDLLYPFQKKEDGTYSVEIYADYRDSMSGGDAAEILQSGDPECALWDKLLEGYEATEWEEKDELRHRIKEELTVSPAAPFPCGLTEEEEQEVDDLIDELVCWELPQEHYLKQDFNVPVMLDTGDGNYDYCLNCVYPHWSGEPAEELDEKSSLLWLALQQGYTREQLVNALNEGDQSNPHGFLESVRVELANLPSSMSTVTFLVKMNLRQLILLNRCIKLQERNGLNYDATKNPDCGHIVLDKKTMCGLFDPWSGGGSVLEIELEKDVEIPIKFIRSALPDGSDGYGVDDVYGLIGSAWKDTVKTIEPPEDFEELETSMRLLATD